MAYGSGTLFKRGKIWWCQWYDGGTRHIKSTGTDDRRAAMAFLQRALSTVGRGGRIRTVGEAIGLLYADYERRDLKSYYITRKRIEANVLPWWGKVPIVKIGASKVDEYAAARRQEGAKAATVNRELSFVRRALTLAHQQGKLSAVPFIGTLPESAARTGFVEPRQYVALRDAMPERIRCLFIVAYHLGCRKGELLSLRWDQVDLAGGVIRLEESQTKTKRGRVLPIYGEMAAALEAQPREGPRVFPVSDFRGAWTAAVTAAGMPRLLFHDLRRSAVRNMERAGIPRSVAMSISGHTTESVYRRYDIVSEKDIHDAAAKMQDRHITVTAQKKKGLAGEG
jgi:integrase